MVPTLPPADGALPAAVLKHLDAPDGTHFDVLLAVRLPTGDDDLVCATWRAPHDPAELPPGAMLELEPIAPHRARYLRIGAPVDLGNGRGTAVPVRKGTWHAGPDRSIEFRWDDGGRTRVQPESMTCWRID